MSDVTRILNAIEQGDARAADELLPIVYQELRCLAAQKLSQEPPGQGEGAKFSERGGFDADYFHAAF